MLFHTLLPFLSAGMLTAFAAPAIVRIARKKRLFDQPNERSSHVQATPRLGGLAMFGGFLFSLEAFGDVGNQPKSGAVLAGAALVFFIGLHDDLDSVQPRKKFLAQIAAALLVFFGAGIGIENWFGLFGVEAIPGLLGAAVSVLAVVGIVNAVNLSDGVNGLAAGQVLLACLFFGLRFWQSGETSMVVLAASLAGALTAFLYFNFRQTALIFMGDGGSLLAGFGVSVLCLRFLQINAAAPAGSPEFESTPALALASLALPVFDTLRVFALRMLNGKSPFSADRNHLHHLLLDLGFSHRRTTAIIVGYNFSLLLLACVLPNGTAFGRLMLIAALAVLPMLGLMKLVKIRREAALNSGSVFTVS